MSAESTPSDPYEVVLADLRSKKAQLEQAISAIEAIRGGVPSHPVSGPSLVRNPQTGAPIDSPGAFLGMNIVDAAKKLLSAKREPLRNPDIAAAFQKGGLVLNSKEPANTIGSVLARRQSEVGDVVKVGRGTWGLKEWYPNRSFRKPIPEPRDNGRPEVLTGLGTVASVPIMITQQMKDRLRAYGKTDEEIHSMTPEAAWNILNDLSDIL